MIAPSDWEKSFNARNEGPTWPEDCFLNPLVQRRREMAHHPVPTKGFLHLSPNAAMLSQPSVETCMPTSPCPALSAGAKPKSQGHWQKWHHELKVVWHIIYASIAYSCLKQTWYILARLGISSDSESCRGHGSPFNIYLVCVIIYCVSALSLHIESTNSMIAQHQTAIIKITCLITFGNNLHLGIVYPPCKLTAMVMAHIWKHLFPRQQSFHWC